MNTFFFNGHKYFTRKSITLTKLISYFSYNPTLFIVEYNRLIFPTNKWNKIEIRENDVIEVITIVGGG